MTKKDWYRKNSWTFEDRVDFEAHLKRSRSSFHKAQYLRIQALQLQDLGTEPMLHAALELLDRLLADYPDPSQLTAALTQRGECLSDLGRYEDALISFRRAFEAQRQFPNIRVNTYLRFGELVVALKRRDLYSEALSLLKEFGGDEVFPVEKYEAAAIQALISEEAGDVPAARLFARAALSAMAQQEPPFPRHKNIGLVRFVDPTVLDRLRALAA
jgi:tetratricopeptide (TPR) repeat protein